MPFEAIIYRKGIDPDSKTITPSPRNINTLPGTVRLKLTGTANSQTARVVAFGAQGKYQLLDYQSEDLAPTQMRTGGILSFVEARHCPATLQLPESCGVEKIVIESR